MNQYEWDVSKKDFIDHNRQNALLYYAKSVFMKINSFIYVQHFYVVL